MILSVQSMGYIFKELIFIHKKLRIRANYKHQAVLMFLFVSFQFAVLCTLNKMGISSYSTLMSSCVLDIGYAVLFYRDSIIRRIFCPDNSIVLLRLLLNCVRPMTKSVRYYDFECPIYGVHFQRVNIYP